MEKNTCPIDYFGVAGNAIVQSLLNQSSNNRERKVAFNNLIRLAKASGLVKKNQDIWYIGYEINRAGAPVIAFIGLPQEVPLSRSPQEV